MKKFAAIALLSASAFGLSANASFADYTLTILHINDWHSRLESNNKYDSTCSAEEEGKGECYGGAARLVTAFGDRRKALEGQNVLVLNAGDNFQGSLFYPTYKGKAEMDFLNQIGFDAMTVGNHEFDDGEEALVPFLDGTSYPVLGANVKTTEQSGANGKIDPSTVVEVGGQKIGIIGVVATETAEIASPGPNISFSDDIDAIKAEVEKLKGEGVNKIVALTHVGYVRDQEIAAIPGVDVVVGGHSHTFLSNTDDSAQGPYPTLVDNPDGHKVPVVTAGAYSKYLGEIAITFDDDGVVKEAKGEPIYLDNSITPDAAAVAKVAELAGPIGELKAREVSETTAPIDGDRKSCRARECEMGNLVADAILDRVGSQGVTIAFQNGGGLRASIDEGVVTMGEVLTVLPFQNTLATFQLTGKDIIASLEHGVSMIEEEKGAFPQVAGLKFSFDRSVPPNAGRIKSVEVMENGAWAPIDEAKSYLVGTNNFTRGGGDGYALFKDNAQNVYDYGPSLEQVVADYLTANRPYTPKLDGRITDVTPASAEAAPAETAAPAEPATPPAEAAPDAPSAAETTPAETAPATAETVPAPAEPAPAEAPASAEPAPTEAPAAEAPAEPSLPAPPPGSADIATTPPAVETTPEPAPEAAPEPTTEAPAPAEPVAPAPETAPAEPAPPVEAAPAAPAETTHIIVAGDTLWDIAESAYGDGSKWRQIAEANPGVRARHLAIGSTLTVPSAD